MPPGKLAELQAKLMPLFLMTADEVSMWGQLLMGHFVDHLDRCPDEGRPAAQEATDFPLLGSVPTLWLMGD